MNKEFTDLVQEYLTDGIISDKERAVLLKKAEKLGIDVDEADLYIEAQEQKAKMANQVLEQECPFCEKSIPQGVESCPHCKMTLNGESVDEFKYILNKLTDAQKALNTGDNVYENKLVAQRYMRKAKASYSDSPKMMRLIKELERSEFQEPAAGTEEKSSKSVGSSSSTKNKLREMFKTVWADKEHRPLVILFGFVIVVLLLIFIRATIVSLINLVLYNA